MRIGRGGGEGGGGGGGGGDERQAGGGCVWIGVCVCVWRGGLPLRPLRAAVRGDLRVECVVRTTWQLACERQLALSHGYVGAPARPPAPPQR